MWKPFKNALFQDYSSGDLRVVKELQLQFIYAGQLCYVGTNSSLAHQFNCFISRFEVGVF